MAAQGKFGWYELMTTDTASAGAFYTSVVGWTAKDVGMPDMPYTSFNIGERGIAGMMKLPEQAIAMSQPPSWIGYIHVDDTDAYVDKVVAAGGALHRPAADVPGMLRFAVVADPQGAPFVLFTANPDMPSPPKPAPGTPGTVGWHELLTSDSAAALEFYATLFGWTKGPIHDMGAMGPYQIFEEDGAQVGGIMTKPPMVPMSCWSYYFNVDGAAAAVERIKAGGGTVVNGPHQVPGGQWIVQGADPQGAMFALVSVKA